MSYKRENDLVSVVVTNYNNENYIGACLDSILNQSYKNIEIILVNDASTDKSINVINEWINNNENKINENFITVIDLPRNVGFSGAVTVGLFASKGEFIAFHDGDDVSHEKRIEEQVKYLKDNNNLNAVGCDYMVFSDENLEPVYRLNGITFGVDDIKDIYAKGGHCVCYGTLLFRGEVFDKVGGLSRNLNLVEDYEYITKLLPFGIDNMTHKLYYYRDHVNQRSKGLLDSTNKPKSEEDLKVLVVFDKFNIGGTETHALALVKGLIDSNINVIVASNDGPLKDEFKKLDCKIYNVDFPLTLVENEEEKLMYENKLKDIITIESVNIVHAHQSPSGSICIDVCNQLKIPCIFTIHGLYYQDIISDKLKLATEVISVSNPVYDWLLNYGITSTIVPNFIDFDTFSNTNKLQDIRKELNIKKDAFVALYCSRFAWGKTLVAENFIRVCRDIKRLEDVDIHALIIGDGPDIDKITQFCKRSNDILKNEYIHMIGPKTKLNDYYNSCDCVVGTGRVAIEAMAFNKPVIASGNLGYFGILKDENLEESWNTYFADHKFNKVNNASYLYKDLKYIIYNKNKFKSLSNTGNTWAKQKFDTKSNIKSIINIYQRAIDKSDYIY
ncbi:MAG: glycosyltransferase [Romboutsia sp.]|uniref:glycosyltransferase n=1 Tax=Romboutsia sp. TaxID=1965302 RepID=UPI003F3BDE7E